MSMYSEYGSDTGFADDPMVEVTCLNSAEVMRVVEKALDDSAVWEFPAASVLYVVSFP
jgi:hypothetical protein